VCITCPAIGLVPVNLLLADTDCKNNVSLVFTNFPNPRAYALKISIVPSKYGGLPKPRSMLPLWITDQLWWNDP